MLPIPYRAIQDAFQLPVREDVKVLSKGVCFVCLRVTAAILIVTVYRSDQSRVRRRRHEVDDTAEGQHRRRKRRRRHSA